MSICFLAPPVRVDSADRSGLGGGGGGTRARPREGGADDRQAGARGGHSAVYYTRLFNFVFI